MFYHLYVSVQVRLFITNSMGSLHNISTRYELIPFNPDELHPIQGKVQVFKHKGSPLYVFGINHASQEFVKTAEQIQKYKHPNLVSYYGNLIKSETVHIDNQYACCPNIKDSSVFWAYHNYTLAHDVEHNLIQRYDPPEEQIWQLIKKLVEASRVLIKHQLFVDLNFHNIGVSPHQKMQLYWGNASVDHSHRAFYQTIFRNSFYYREGFSPQQLKSLRKEKITTKFDLEKCVMHSLGRLILLYANNSYHMTDIIDYKTLVQKTDVIQYMLKKVSLKYSIELAKIIASMLEENPFKRVDFQKMREYFRSEQFAQLQYLMSTRKKGSEEVISTNGYSRKSSIYAGQF